MTSTFQRGPVACAINALPLIRLVKAIDPTIKVSIVFPGEESVAISQY
jgi:hypothetical protein